MTLASLYEEEGVRLARARRTLTDEVNNEVQARLNFAQAYEHIVTAVKVSPDRACRFGPMMDEKLVDPRWVISFRLAACSMLGGSSPRRTVPLRLPDAARTPCELVFWSFLESISGRELCVSTLRSEFERLRRCLAAEELVSPEIDGFDNLMQLVCRRVGTHSSDSQVMDLMSRDSTKAIRAFERSPHSGLLIHLTNLIFVACQELPSLLSHSGPIQTMGRLERSECSGSPLLPVVRPA